jgi:hypothetical protein
MDPIHESRRTKQFVCRYCAAVLPSAAACQEHQRVRHLGVGDRLVTDVEEGRATLHRAEGEG